MKFVEWRSVRPARFFVQFSGHRWRRPTEDWVSLSCALFFLVHDSGYFSRYIDFADTHFQNKIIVFTTNYLANFNSKLIWCGIVIKVNETLRAWGANSYFPLRSPPYLGTNGPIFLVSNCPQLEWRDQLKQTRILKLEYQMRIEEWTPTRSRVEAVRQGRGRLDYFFFVYFFIVNKWTTETSFISSIKYCYLQYLCCLLCNPTTWVNQINPLKAQTQWNITRGKGRFLLTAWTQASV